MAKVIDMEYLAKEKHQDTQGVFLLDVDGKIIYANERAKQFFDINVEKSFLSVIPQKDREKIYSLYKKLSRGDSILYTSRPNREKAFEISLHPISKENKAKMFVGTIRDVTKIREMELYAKKICKREKLFRENVSHYFFNPLVIAGGYLQLLLDEKQSGEEKRKLEAIKTAVERIEAVVKNTVNGGKIEE